MRDIIWACWALVGVVLVGGGLQAQFSGSRPQMQNLRTSLVWLVYGGIIGFVTQVVPRRAWTPLAVAGPGFRAAGVVLALIGSLWIVWSRYTLGSQFTEAPTIGANHHLVTHGDHPPPHLFGGPVSHDGNHGVCWVWRVGSDFYRDGRRLGDQAASRRTVAESGVSG